jgi:uncharacterized protein YlxW (UPF0749 family)
MILSILVGVMLALPFKVITRERTEVLPDESRQELLNRMTKISEENDQLRVELGQVRDRSSSLEEALMSREQTSEELSQSMTMYRILAGLEPVHGPGVRVTLSETDTEIPPGSPVRPYLIHHLDLLNIVNEMWLAGAEAIGISSSGRTERLIVDSSIRCVGSLIDVNNTGMTPPFDIFAIGNPDNLYASLTMRGGVLEPLALYDIESEVVKLDDIQLPAYAGSTLLEYAKPAGEE